MSNGTDVIELPHNRRACWSCLHWKPVGGAKTESGLCVRFPPSQHLPILKRTWWGKTCLSVSRYAQHPMTHAGTTCGEWAPRNSRFHDVEVKVPAWCDRYTNGPCPASGTSKLSDDCEACGQSFPEWG